MKRYSRKVFVVILLLSLVIFDLVRGTVQTRQYSEEKYIGPMGLPAEYHSIIAQFQGDRESSVGNDVFDRLLEVLSKEDKATAILLWQEDTYLYDPSGYYNVSGIKGEYFSKEDFKSHNENNVMIFNYSPYTLMLEDGMIYYSGEYRHVVGEYSSQHPLYRVSYDKIIPMAPGRLNFNTTSLSNTMNMSFTFYIANCNEGLYKEAEMAVQKAGWNIIDVQSVYGSSSEEKGILYNIFFAYKEYVAMLLMLVMGMAVLRRQAAVSFGGDSFRHGFAAGVIPALTGAAAGSAISGVAMVLLGDNLTWVSVIACVTACFVLGLLMITMSCIRIRRKHTSRNVGWLGKSYSMIKTIYIPIGAVVLICLSICIAAYNMQVVPYIIKEALTEKELSHVQVVSFSAYMIEKDGTLQKLSLNQAIEGAINSGNAFSILRINNEQTGFIVVGSEAFKRMYKLDWTDEIPAAYVKKSNPNLKKGESINVGGGTRDKTVEVVRYLDKSFSLYMYSGGVSNLEQDVLALMDLKDFKEAGHDPVELMEDIYFLDPDGKLLNEFTMKMDAADIEWSMDMFGRGTGQSYKDNLKYYMPLVGLTMAMGIMVYFFILAAAGIMAERRYTEMKTAMLYGGGYRSIWLKVFPLAAVITIPAGALAGIGDLYILLSYVSSSYSFMIPREATKEFSKQLIGKMPVGAAGGLMLAAVVSTIVAGEVGTVLNLLQIPADGTSRGSSEQL